MANINILQQTVTLPRKMFLNQVQTTLSVVEEERDRFMAKLLSEEKSRKSMEGDLADWKTGRRTRARAEG